MTEIVKVRNTSPDKPLKLRHDVSPDIVIAPGAERIVPSEYATIAFGNPAARNEGKQKNRDAELKAARTWWGHYPGIDTEEDWERDGPKFEVYDMDGNRIWMVLDDPTGEHAAAVAGAILDGPSDSDVIGGRIEQLEAQIAKLTALLTAQTPDTAVPVPAPTDTEPEDATTGDDPAAPVEGQTERNEARDDIPKPRQSGVKKDGPRTTRVGGR